MLRPRYSEAAGGRVILICRGLEHDPDKHFIFLFVCFVRPKTGCLLKVPENAMVADHDREPGFAVLKGL